MSKKRNVNGTLKLRKVPLEQVLRLRRFRDLYLAGATPLQAALHAGYSPGYAKNKAGVLVDKAEDSIRDQCESLGVTKAVLAEVLVSHLNAQDVRWNPIEKEFEKVDDYVAQREAYDRLKEILEPKPPEVINHNVRIGVDAGNPKEATREGWLEKFGPNKRRQVGELVTAAGGLRPPLETESGAAGSGNQGEMGS